ncbi:MAG TPA: aromatic-ring-hydroxylating dioxygenase subunit beta [Stellaceae bacterium]|jgi:3-phenylpropionate/cinnamic acid dioxygenase small subunit|nr:aromatic-ring-hydroxylating dioxygenase subunit beta [Stellaceae bacterium]
MTDTRSLVENLNARYVAAIDDDRLEDWPAFFTDPCRYEIISAENVERGMPLGVFFADSRAMLADRVASLRRANIYDSQRYRHIVSATLILDEEKTIVRAQSNFLVVRIMLDGEMRLFMSGRYRDVIDTSGPAPLFAEKRAIFDNRRIDTLLALPI